MKIDLLDKGLIKQKKHGIIDKDGGSEVYKVVKNQEKIARDKAKNSSTSDLQLMRKLHHKGVSQAMTKRGKELAKSKLGANDNEAKNYVYLSAKQAKKQYGRTYGAELKKRGYDPKTGEKLKEAAEYILSVLDEIDTIEDLKNQKKMIIATSPSDMKEKLEEINKKIKLARNNTIEDLKNQKKRVIAMNPSDEKEKLKEINKKIKIAKN